MLFFKPFIKVSIHVVNYDFSIWFWFLLDKCITVYMQENKITLRYSFQFCITLLLPKQLMLTCMPIDRLAIICISLCYLWHCYCFILLSWWLISLSWSCNAKVNSQRQILYTHYCISINLRLKFHLHNAIVWRLYNCLHN